MSIRPKHVCKDCWLEYTPDQQSFILQGYSKPKVRPAPYKGPRCKTHHYKWEREHKQKAAVVRDEKVYGLKPGGFEALMEVQEGKCAICRTATGATRRLSVDHNHKTGNVRGALCRPCNTLLGRARDQIEFFLRAVDYLRSPPADKLPDSYFTYKDQSSASEEDRAQS